MPSKPGPRFAEPDTLCFACGLERPIDQANCPHCNSYAAMAPDLATIYARATELRALWPL